MKTSVNASSAISSIAWDPRDNNIIAYGDENGAISLATVQYEVKDEQVGHVDVVVVTWVDSWLPRG